MTIVSDKGLFALLLFVFSILWASFCINWYVCGVKGFCDVAAKTAAVVPVAQHIDCAPLLTTDIIRGERNNAREVARLQQFFNAVGGTQLEVTGYYGAEDEAMVRRYQAAYAQQILAPWGIAQPTGRVQSTTRAAINAQYCAHQSSL